VWDKSELPVSLTRDQIENSPEISEDEPLSRQKEEELHSYFGWQPYWVDRITGEDYGPPIPAGDEMTGDRQADSVPQDPVPGDPDLLSAESVVGYEIQATDARIGRVDDFLLDDESWEIEYLVIDTGDENENKKTLLASELIERISFDEYAVFVDLDQETIRKSPEYDPSNPINKGYEEALQKHFGY
jgi:sporulation protein YlmC with PRC-barrel domain